MKLICIALLCLGAQASAAPLTLTDVVRTGLKRSPRLKEAQAISRSAHYNTREAKGEFLPTVDAHGTATKTVSDAPVTVGNSRDATDYRAYLEATLPVYSGGETLGNLRRQQTLQDIAELEARQTEQIVLTDIITGYYNVAEQSELTLAAQDNVDVLKSYAEVLRRYEKIGRARRSDKLQSLINMASADADLRQLQVQLLRERENLRAALGVEELPEVAMSKEGGLKILNVNADASVQRALKQNPSILIAEKTRDNVSNIKTVALAEDLPSVILRGQYGYRAADRSDLFTADTKYTAVILDLNIPLFSGLTSLNKRRSYNEQYTQAVRSLEQTKLTVEADVRAAVKELIESHDRLETARVATEQAREALKLVNADYQKSVASHLDVVNMQRTRYDVVRLYVQTQYDFLRARLNLQQLEGQKLASLYGGER